MISKKLLALLGGATLALGVAAGLGPGGIDIGPGRSEPDVRSFYMTTGPEYPTLVELTKASAVVVRARVVDAGQTRTVASDPAQLVTDPPPQNLPRAKQEAIAQGTPEPVDVEQRREDRGTLMTDTTVEVLEVIYGSGPRVGQRLTVVQLGGTDRTGQHVEAEHNPLLKRSEEEILFLKRNPTSGKYFPTGSGQGRYKVAGRDRVESVNPDSRVGRAHNGNSVAAFTAAIQTVR
jgi:hypothetical protein